MRDENETAATEVEGEGAPAAPTGASQPLPERYEDLRLLGSGGFGDVRRVYDKKLERVIAMKIVRPDAADVPKLRRRFLTEIKLSASLHHPGIVALHDYGELADGRLWFTMPEVRGRTLRAVIEQAFSPRAAGDPHTQRRRLVDLFARVCEAMAYAHSRGVIHRDLKPENIMVGEFGRVMVMDWGLARRVSDVADPDERLPVAAPAADEPNAAGRTQRGEVMGTPAYMPPEQILGDIGLHGPSTDVYALGAVLYHVLSGRPPFRGRREVIWRRVLDEGPEPLSEGQVSVELAAICARAMERAPADRYVDAGELAAAIEASLSGAMRRERALEELSHALGQGPAITALRARAGRLRVEARALLSPTRGFDPVSRKQPGWDLEDEADRLDHEATLAETAWIQRVHGALAIDPETPEAHAALADHYRSKLAAAERGRQSDDAARAEILLRAHDRGRHAAFLSGKGALTLITDPPSASVILERYVLRGRRLEPEVLGAIGLSPILDRPLEKGSYRLRVAAPGYAEVCCPVLIERGERWDCRPPGGGEAHPLVLPPIGEIGEDEVYVPAGWTWIGGDPDAPDSLPQQRVWVEGFIAGRFPVTSEQYVAFLNDLIASGREGEALAACPRMNQGIAGGADDQLSFDRDASGRFHLKAADIMEVWALRGPVVLTDWRGAAAYARWRAAKTGRPYRLLHEIEREKAVRGVDGRNFPWGDFFDPTWACMVTSHRAAVGRAEVDDYPFDESPYGLRGGAGNTRDFCINPWTLEGPEIVGERLIVDTSPPEGDDLRSVRGGAYLTVVNHCRAAARFANRVSERRSVIGLRLGRAWPS